MMNKCKIIIGKCNICGHVRGSDQDRVCHMEIYDPDEQWICPETKTPDRFMMALIAIAGCAGIAKFLGWW